MLIQIEKKWLISTSQQILSSQAIARAETRWRQRRTKQKSAPQSKKADYKFQNYLCCFFFIYYYINCINENRKIDLEGRIILKIQIIHSMIHKQTHIYIKNLSLQ